MLVLTGPAQAAEAISKQQAMNTAQQNNPGRVLSIKQSGKVYRVKILSSSGEVRIVLVNAQSGKVVNK